MKKYLWLFFALLMACKSYKRHKRLLDFQARYAATMGDLNHDEKRYQQITSDRFNPKTDTIQYLNGIIYISHLSVETGCAKYDGAIKFKSDSIFLDVKNVGDNVCTEEVCYRLIYLIENRTNKHYKIIKRTRS